MPDPVDAPQASRYDPSMADIVNLRMARKARARSDRDAQAAANRAASGRTKAEKRLATDEAARRDALLDGAKRAD